LIKHSAKPRIGHTSANDISTVKQPVGKQQQSQSTTKPKGVKQSYNVIYNIGTLIEH
jgi:hypothetical protein